MDIKFVQSYKLPIFVGGIIILLLILWWTGTVGSGISAWNRMIAAKEKKIFDTLKGEIRVITEKLKVVEKKEKAKDQEIVIIQKEQQKIKEAINEVKKERDRIEVPANVDDLVVAMRKSGIKSATVAIKPR